MDVREPGVVRAQGRRVLLDVQVLLSPTFRFERQICHHLHKLYWSLRARHT